MTDALLTIQKLHKNIVDGRTRVSVLNDLNLQIDKGEFVSIIGPSGSGKSTLLHILGLLDKPSSGEYWFSGEPVYRYSGGRLSTFRNRRIGFVFQSFMLLPRMNVQQNVELPLLYASISRKARKERCKMALESVGMWEKSKQRAVNLSGGEKQRVAIARALVNDPSLLLADEPTGNLDEDSKNGILQIFSELKSQGRTIVMVTHDREAANIADRMLRIHNGQLVTKEED